MPFSTSLLNSPMRQAERTLRRPSSAVWLRTVRLRTAHFDEALAFYVTTLGLTLGAVDVHPVTAMASARLLDAEGHAVVEIVDDAAGTDASGTGLSFAMPRRTVTLLRARLQAAGIETAETGHGLSFCDPDGVRLRVETL